MNKIFPRAALCSTLLGLFYTSSISAEPWIDTSDIYLKANIQLLADTGIILTPVTTYPLMWHDVHRDIKNLNTSLLSEEQKNAYYYVKHQFKLAQQNQVRIKAQTAVEDSRFTSFGDTYRDANSLQVQTTTMIGNIASNVSLSYHPSADDKDDKKRWDNSYLAAFLGNWVIAAGKQDRWFGPTWDTSLSLTNNARPITAVSLTRKSAEAFTIPFTEFDIPWTVTTFMGKMDDERIVKNTLLWGFRLNFKPMKNLEFGITRLAQWGGEDRPQDLKTFWNVLIGKDNCGAGGLDCSDNQEPGNQQAGWDMRYSFNLFDTPMALYGQYFAEDGANEGGLKMVTKAQVQGGIDMHVNLFNSPTRLFLEVTDSYGDCNTGPGVGNCYYEHHIYKTGMRFQGRTLGSLYDNDAKTIVLGGISQLSTNTRLTSKFRYLDLNYDNSDKAPDNPIIGNPLTSIAEQMVMASASIQHSYKNWRFTLGTDISHSSYENDIDSETDFNASLTVEYNL
ncbi:capsule assembly Wzi family protein [Litorilituus sediminis]|uniref:Capsule assembly Wzi family protein n=1 Tax=Litorilituus sediminis TaxID=718192 RepID=A0A4P6P431_9GAMM|nr:capsule assembly Wzi family protein [Litorilituus sediminis]QBG35648.1 capsule assembly Wzi family protein [Litorilituus sediminis]